jgi:hypothetical protein
MLRVVAHRAGQLQTATELPRNPSQVLQLNPFHTTDPYSLVRRPPQGTNRMADGREQEDDRRTIVFFHPDLGIGGAERLIIDAAVGLQQRGNRVVIFTSHCDPKHCFDEARDGT